MTKKNLGYGLKNFLTSTKQIFFKALNRNSFRASLFVPNGLVLWKFISSLSLVSKMCTFLMKMRLKVFNFTFALFSDRKRYQETILSYQEETERTV